jgi:hypothetical protein
VGPQYQAIIPDFVPPLVVADKGTDVDVPHLAATAADMAISAAAERIEGATLSLTSENIALLMDTITIAPILPTVAVAADAITQVSNADTVLFDAAPT